MQQEVVHFYVCVNRMLYRTQQFDVGGGPRTPSVMTQHTNDTFVVKLRRRMYAEVSRATS
jgi:hypothetical protein